MSNNVIKLRTAFIRISAVNVVKKNNKKLGVKVGDIVEYTLKDIIDILEKWYKTKKFFYYAIEHVENDQIHFHIVLQFFNKSSCAFSTLKSKFPYGDIESCKNVQNCVQYLVHMNNPEKKQYSFDEVITNAPEKLEMYKLPRKPSDKVILAELINKIRIGELHEYEIEKIPIEIYSRHASKINNAFAYVRKLALNKPRDLTTYVLQGPAGFGKSSLTKAIANKRNASICFSSSSNDVVEPYSGQDILVLDDFTPVNWEFTDIVKMLDPHVNSSIKSRYNNKVFSGDTIFICTNSDILSWYEDIENSHKHLPALYRRIKNVFVFESLVDGIATYSIKEIILRDDPRMESIKYYGPTPPLAALYPPSDAEPLSQANEDYLKSLGTFNLGEYIASQSKNNTIDVLDIIGEL